ncbi:ATP-dependent DNA ligase [Limtongia smithiae]|uniref:ATP-dependent DNA ligase n=1 Tax=Limtongia smithiae TaxID=1125753 RepID=UPI0034CF71CD
MGPASTHQAQASLTRFFARPAGAKAEKRQATLHRKKKDETTSDGEEKIDKFAEEESDKAEKVEKEEKSIAPISPPPTASSPALSDVDDIDKPKAKRQRRGSDRIDTPVTNLPASAPPPARAKSPPKNTAALETKLPPLESDSSSTEREDEINAELKLTESTLAAAPKWAPGAPVPYAAMTATFEKIEATTKRLEIISLCSSFFQEVLLLTPAALLPVIYLFVNRLGPDYEGVEIGLGEATLMKAIGESTGRSQEQIKLHYRKTGDLGMVASESRASQPTMFKPRALTAESVFANTKAIATASGAQSQARKIGIINKLLSACENGSEAKFLVRSLEGKLRIHLAEKTVLTSLAQAVVGWEAHKAGKNVVPEDVAKAEQILKDVYSEMPTYDRIVPALVEHGIMRLREFCTLTPGVPLKPMLAKPTKSITEVLDRFHEEKFTCEYKYDGERAQIHFVRGVDGKKDSFHVYSRNSEDMSSKYPDILSVIPRIVDAETTSFVLDCEAVAWDREQHRILPFQVLSTRKRKDVSDADIKVRVCVFAFDVLYFNGESQLQRPLDERRGLLHTKFFPREGEFAFAKYMDGTDVDSIQEFLDQSVKDSCEGLMVKMLSGAESFYEPSKRSRNWLKLKKDYLTGVGDSLDLVVIGGFFGKGKRTNWYGAFLLACYNSDTQEYESICKIGTGFSEEMLTTLHATLSTKAIPEPRSYYSYNASAPPSALPDVWFEPVMVWEVLAADLSLSPVYKAAIAEVGRGKGVSLRFPRFIRIRDDKAPEDATSAEQVCEFYHAQASAGGNGGGGEGGEGDDY